MARATTGKVSSLLEKALSDELKEITRKHPDDAEDDAGKSLKGRFVYSSTERMRIIDRYIKLEQLKQRVDDTGFGSNFGKPDGES